LTTNQKYTFGVCLIDGVYYGRVTGYNSTGVIAWVDLYISRDGLAWDNKLDHWIPAGDTGSWDGGFMDGGKSTFIRVGNDWRVYYFGTVENHAHATPRDGRIGLANIGYKRIGNIEGVGTLTTTAFTPTEPLMINADLTNGTLKVELLLAADNSVIAGYSKDDMDALSGDTYSTEVKWGGNSIPTDQAYKLKFYLT